MPRFLLNYWSDSKVKSIESEKNPSTAVKIHNKSIKSRHIAKKTDNGVKFRKS